MNQHPSKPYPVAYINVDALKHNVGVIRDLAPNKKILVVVKADAYGHGLTIVSKFLEPMVEGFGVARLEEALMLRKHGIRNTIVVMGGFEKQEEWELIAKEELSVVIHSPFQLTCIPTTKQLTKPVKVWVKLETGMHRLGLLEKDLEPVWEFLRNNPNVDSEKVLMSHFAESENLDSFSMHRQIETFDRMTQHYKAQHSLANSAAVVSSQDTHRDWIRMGALIYGISPFPHRSAPSLGLKPVMTLASYIKSIKAIKKGDKVGYCGIWQAEEDTLIAIVAMGYGDGYPRLISKDTYVLLNGRKATIIGRVSMDLIAISLKNNEQAQVGDEVIFWGEGLPVEHVAKEVGTDPREIVTGLTNRVHRIISNNTR